MSTHVRKKRRRFSPAQKVLIFLCIVAVVLSAATIALLADNIRLRGEIKSLQNDTSSQSVSESSGLVTTSSDLVASSSDTVVTSSNSAITSSQGSSSGSSDSSDGLWMLRLANGENVLPADFTVDTGLITPAYARDQGMSFDARAVGELNKMLAAADRDGVNLLVISCFRTLTKQTNLYNAEVQKWLNQGYSEADAKAKAGTIVAVPGTSDHNLGLAVDLNSVEESFEGTAQFRWLQDHAAEYGFVMRYPKDKQDITKIIYEPWHYRYVGVEHAKKMNELDMCLEEYVKYLGITF